MFSISKAAWLPVCALVGLHVMPAPALAQATPSAGPATAVTHPAAAADPAALYRSPFTGYQPFAEPTVVPWRDTNDRVRQRGGWRAYAREASAPASAPLPPGAGHSGHRMK